MKFRMPWNEGIVCIDERLRSSEKEYVSTWLVVIRKLGIQVLPF